MLVSATRSMTVNRSTFCIGLRTSLGSNRRRQRIKVELLKHGPGQLVAGKITFRQLAQFAKDNIYVAAVYDDQETIITALANLLGHSDMKMTMRYYNRNKKTIDKARDILNRRAVVNT